MKQSIKILALTLLALAGAYQFTSLFPEQPPSQDYALQQAYLQRESKVWIYHIEAEVQRVLADDNRGSRHQRLLVETAAIPSLLVAHSLDLAPRVPVQAGDVISISGRYEWNEKGGVIHWTHHDPDGKLPGGGIQFDGEVYR